MTINVSLFVSYIKTICNLLWRSVSSVDFYREVYSSYRGYGVKYIFTLCFFASFFYSASFMYNISLVYKALTRADNKSLEHILSQVPEMKYNGSILSTEVDTPYFISDLGGRRIAVIDLDGDLSFIDKSKIPVVLTKSNMIIYLSNASGKNSGMPIVYSNLLGKDPWVITSNSLREYLTKAISINGVFFVLAMPIIAILIFMQLITKLIVPVGVLYFILNFSGIPTRVNTIVRLFMFASGAFLVSNAVFMLLWPEYRFFADIIHMIAGGVMVLSLVRWNKTKFGAP